MSKSAAGVQYGHGTSTTQTLQGPAQADSSPLPTTGFDPTLILMLGGALIALGLGFWKRNRSRRNHFLTLMVTLALFGAMAAPASAGGLAGIENEVHVENAYNAALATWKPNHCPGRNVELYTFDARGEKDFDNVIAFVPFLGSCRILFNLYANSNYARITFQDTMVHEMGHVAYAKHNGDKGDIMYPFAGEYGPHWGGNFLVSGQLQHRFKRYGHLWDYSTAHKPIPAPASTTLKDHGFSRTQVSRVDVDRIR